MRKSAVNADLKAAIEEAKTLIEIRHELAQEAYDFQDDATKAVIDRIVSRLRLSAGGYITVHVNPPHGNKVPVKFEQAYLDFNLLYVATEILKDNALFDIRIASYKFPPSQCVTCGVELTKEAKPKKRRAA
jgi:hypothetical protein